MQMRKANPAGRLTARAIVGVLAGAVGLTAAAVANAADHPFPSKPITLIVPGAPGGALDLVARALAGEVGQALGQPIIVDLKPGATPRSGRQRWPPPPSLTATRSRSLRAPLCVSP